MNPESFCTEFNSTINREPENSGRRLSTSWDNGTKNVGLTVPRVDQRRNSHTLAQLLECHQQLSLNQDDSPSFEFDLITEKSRPSSRRASVGSRRPSVAEMLVDNGLSKTTDDCLLVTQTLGTSTTLFFQKNPLVDNLDLRPSAVERGLYNFDDSIKDVPPIKYQTTPRPSIQLLQTPKSSILTRAIPSIDESDGDKVPDVEKLTIRPSINERGLPAMKFTPVLPNGQLQLRGRTLQKQPRADPRFDFELDNIIASRRRIIDEEETRRERENQIRPRVQQVKTLQYRPHNFDGRFPVQVNGNVMEELRGHIETGEVDRIVKEKKTTTVTETREIVYFTHRLPSSIAISTRLSPTGVPVQNQNRKSITVEGSLPTILDRPYVRQEAKSGSTPDGKPTHMKTVTIRVPDDQTSQTRGHAIHRSATPSPNNTADSRREKNASP